jgi:hypothetical protein
MIGKDDGKQYGYEVTNPTHCSWVWSGLGAGGSHARVVVEGLMHRKGRDPELQARVDEIAAATPELEQYEYVRNHQGDVLRIPVSEDVPELDP